MAQIWPPAERIHLPKVVQQLDAQAVNDIILRLLAKLQNQIPIFRPRHFNFIFSARSLRLRSGALSVSGQINQVPSDRNPQYLTDHNAQTHADQQIFAQKST